MSRPDAIRRTLGAVRGSRVAHTFDSMKPLLGIAPETDTSRQQQAVVSAVVEEMDSGERAESFVARDHMRFSATALDLSSMALAGSMSTRIIQLRTLEILDLRNNNITDLPSEIGSLGILQTLQLDNNRLSALPESISALTSMRRLTADHNYLTRLPDGICGMNALILLSVNHNVIQELPIDLHRLRSLHTLLASHNRLTDMRSACGVRQLRTLNLSTNDFSAPDAVPPSISEMRYLMSLDLSSCRIAALTLGVGMLLNLRSLNVAHNELTTLPNLGQLTRLRELHAEGNHFARPQRLRAFLLEHIPALRERGALYGLDEPDRRSGLLSYLGF